MEYGQLIFIGLLYIALAVSAIGAFLPIIPGPILAAAAILIFKLVYADSPVSWGLVVFALVISAAVQVGDFALTYLGAKKFGATWRGALGAFVGVFAGIFMPPPLLWIFLAPLVFAFAFEYFGDANFRKAIKAGTGAFIGTLAASALKFLATVLIAFWLTSQLFF